MSRLSLVVAGGGTAGHVEPALAIADRARTDGHRVVLLGTAFGLETRLVPARGHELRTIARVPFPRRASAELIRLPARATAAVRGANRVLEQVRADVVVGVGGYVAFPAYLAARGHGLGIVVHEANPLPGLANRVGARLTREVGVARDGTPLPHAVTVGIPLRDRVRELDRAAERDAARAALGLDGHRPTVLVTGGSQGAHSLNQAALSVAAEVAAAGGQLLLAAGSAHADAVRATASGLAHVVVVAYLDDMPKAYAAADLMVCRAGAMTCAEAAAVGLPAIYVPLPIGNGEQRLNAEPIVAAGGGLLLDDAELDRLPELLLPMLRQPQSLTQMGERARRTQPADPAGAVLAMAVRAAERSRAGRRAARPD